MKKAEHETIFDKGSPNPYGQYFSGKSYLAMLAELNGVGIANVTFEPAATTGIFITAKTAADRFYLSPAAGAGIRNGAGRQKSFMPGMWLQFRRR